MDLLIRQHLCTAEKHQDAEALLKAYKFLKDANTPVSAVDVPENFSSDLYALCAEQALQLENVAISKDCLEMYFKSTPPANQFFGRAYLCKGQLHAPKSANDVDELEKSVAFYLIAIVFAKKQQRYYFLVYNASILYWQMARPFLKPGSRHLLIPGLTSIVKALDEIDEPDKSWRAELMFELLECLIDAQKNKEAADFATVASEYVKNNVPLKYPQLFTKMVQYKLIDSAKASKESKTSITLSAIYKIQKLKLQLNIKEQYEEVSRFTYERSCDELFLILNNAREQGNITKKEFDFLVNLHPIEPTFYCIPKLHKSMKNPPGRPIVSGIDGPTKGVSRYIDFYLRPFLTELSSYVQETGDVLRRLDKVKIDSDTLLLTLDVESLYSSIPHKVGLSAAKHFLMLRGEEYSNNTTLVLKLIEFVLTNNIFMFDDDQEAITDLVQLLNTEEILDSDSVENPLTPTEEISVSHLDIKVDSGFKRKSEYMPPLALVPAVKLFVREVEKEINKISFDKITKDNLNRDERNALHDLMNKSGIIIKQADKGGNLVVMNETNYVNEVKRQLKNKDQYMALQLNPIASIQTVLLLLLNKARKDGVINKRECDYLYTKFPRVPVFYCIPKLHKNLRDPPGHPIISGIGSITENLGNYVDRFLKPFLLTLTSYVKDTSDLLRKLDGLEVEPDVLLVSLDVEGLYSSIPHEVGLKAARHFLESRGPMQSEHLSATDIFTKLNEIYKHLAMATPEEPTSVLPLNEKTNNGVTNVFKGAALQAHKYKWVNYDEWYPCTSGIDGLARRWETHLNDIEHAKLQRDWVGRVEFASYKSTSRGVAILFGKKLEMDDVSVVTDPEGRYIVVRTTIAGKRYTLCNIYAPNKKDRSFWEGLIEVLTPFLDTPIILGGDFKLAPNPQCDRLRDQSRQLGGLQTKVSCKFEVDTFQSLTSALDIVDIWRKLNPDGRDFTCVSRSSPTMSRIDLFMVSNSLIPQVVDTKIGDVVVSDHAPVGLFLDTLPRASGRRTLRFPQYLLTSQEFQHYMEQAWDDFQTNNAQHRSNPELFWHTAKAVLTGDILAFLSRRKKLHTERLERLREQLADKFHLYRSSPTLVNYQKYMDTKKEYDALLAYQASQALLRTRGRYYRFGDKSGRLLASLVNLKSSTRFIAAIRSMGTLTKDPKRIVETFASYYSDLYASNMGDAEETKRAFWDSIELPQVSEDQLSKLNAPISREEVDRTIMTLNLGKAAGPDGLPIEFYRLLKNRVVPVLTDLFQNYFTEANKPTKTFTAAHITLIPKAGKDALLPESYRPISLLNSDYKILTKLLAERLKFILPDLIHEDQTGFMVARSSVVNVRRILQVLQHFWSLKQSGEGGAYVSGRVLLETFLGKVTMGINLLSGKQPGFRISLLVELAHLSVELKCYPVAASCINNLKNINITDPREQIILECLECEYSVQNLGMKIATYTKSVIETQLQITRRLESALQEAIRLGDPNIIQVVCSTQWNICLPLLQHNLRKHMKKPLISISEALENIDSLQTLLRCQIHLEIAYIEEEEDHIEVALKHIQKALLLDNNGQYESVLKAYLHRLQLSVTLYKKPEGLEDQAALIIEQAKQSNSKDSVRKKRSLLVNAGLCLAPDVFQMVLDSENDAKVSTGKNNKNDNVAYLSMKAEHHMKCVQKTEGHLNRMANKNANERVRLWADLAKIARKQEVWDVCRTACRFCLLYDDDRWKVPKQEVLQKKKSAVSNLDEGRSGSVELESSNSKIISFSEERSLLRTLAEIRFINAEATIHLLKSEGCKLNEYPNTPEDTSFHPAAYVAKNLEEQPEWIVYKEWIVQLSVYATENFLRASELGVELNESWITHNAAVYILNYNKYIIAAGRLTELTETFQKLLSNLKKTGHSRNTVLFVTLSNNLARGLILRWIPVSEANKRPETTQHTEKSKKAPGKQSEKSNIPQAVSIDTNGVPDVKLALETCEYALELTNGNTPEELVPISIRQGVLSTWVKAKQLLQQQIGPKLGTDDEDNDEGQNPMTRVLVALEMHSCNGLGLKDFIAPSLSQIFKMASECIWSDPLIELQTLTRLAHFAYNAHDHELVLACSKKALEFNKETTAKKINTHSFTLEQEMLSVAACIQGQSIIDNCFGRKHLRLTAIQAFQLSASCAAEAGNFTLTLQSAKHFWHACSPFITLAEDREPLKDATISVIKAITDAESKLKQKPKTDVTYLHLWPSIDVQSCGVNTENSKDNSKDTDFSDDEHKLRVSLYEFLFKMYEDKNDWEAGLKVLDEAIQILQRTKHRLVIFKHRVLVKARLGQNFFMDIQKFKDESEDYLSYIWHLVALTAENTSEQLACYQNAIDALQKPENEWQKVDYLMEFAEWLYCNQFPLRDALNQLDWAVDILLQMKFSNYAEEDKSQKAKLKARKKSSMHKDQRNDEDTEATKSEDGDTFNISHNAFEDLRNVRQLETLVRAYTLMAVICGPSSPYHEQHCLMAYAYVMRIWKVSLTAAGSFIKTSQKNPPPPQNPLSASSQKEKGKKDVKEPIMIKEKPKRKGSVDVLPLSAEEWAVYDCPDEVRDAFKLDTSCSVISRNTIVKPTFSLYYLDLLIKQLLGISFTHLTLPVLHLAEVIAHDAVESKSLSDFYHLRLCQICADLNLHQAASYHEKAVSNMFITEHELISCRQEMLINKTKKKNEMCLEQSTNHHLMHKKPKILALHATTKGLSGLSLPYLWMDKAYVLIQLGFFHPAKHLLSEAYKCFQEFGDNQDISKCLYLLSLISNSENNHGQAKLLLMETQHIENDAEFLYKATMSMADAVLGENGQNKEDKACKILEMTLNVLKNLMPKQTNRRSELGYFLASLHTRKLSILTQISKTFISRASSQATVRLLDVCDKLNQIENDLLCYGYKELMTEVMMEHSEVLRTLANIAEDTDRKHSYYLDAYRTAERAISIQEQVLCNTQRLFPTETISISLPSMRTIAKMKLKFCELSLEMIQLIITEESEKLQEQKSKGKLCVAVEEFVRSTPDYNSIEQEWKTLGHILGSTVLSQLASVMTLAMGCNDLKAKCLYYTGKCLYVLSVKVDPLSHDMYWNEKILDESKAVMSEQDNDDFEWSTGFVQLTNRQQETLSRKTMELKRKRAIAQRYLAQASEILLQSINTAISNNLLSTLSTASLQMCSCLGQFDPTSSAMFLALYQSSSASMIMKDAVSAASCNTSSSQFAALFHLHQLLQKKGDPMSNLQKNIEQKLSATSKVWENFKISIQHLNIFNDLPPNFNVIILQHSEDRSFLYGAFLENSKVNPVQKGKTSQPQKNLRAKVVRCAVSPQMFMNLLERMELFKHDIMHLLLKKDNQLSFNKQNHSHEKTQDVNINAGMNFLTNTEDEDEKKMSTAFHEIVDAMEEYLNPVLHQLDISSFRQISTLLSASESGKVKSRDKEEKTTESDRSNVDTGEYIILLADKALMELPLEAMSTWKEDWISSVSRDFSLQLFYNRMCKEDKEEDEAKRDTKSGKDRKPKSGQKKNIKIAPIDRTLPANCISLDTHKFKYIVDPYNEENEPEFSPGFRMKRVIEKYNQQFTPLWDGIIGSSRVPSHGEWENVMNNCSAFVFYGTERFLNNILLDKLVAMNFTECQMMILLDLVRTNRSFLRQSKVDVQKSKIYMALERPVETAILLSVSGIRSVMLNQWHTSLDQNAKRLDFLSENLLELGKTTGQTIHYQRKFGSECESSEVNEDQSFSDDKQEMTKPTCLQRLSAWNPSPFNYVLYGLPNLVVM
ncbi:cilia- and flagella-associated protein 46-like [Bombina bombina]|uniref:cilia- and flagella-associated protein 46-like n=1 Tax=Bombina bombina TaxID=8345 RepID=UPI00235A6DC3|nr:cilia- and flagella-associated protein 46-like [Bombina bombina]